MKKIDIIINILFYKLIFIHENINIYINKIF